LTSNPELLSADNQNEQDSEHGVRERDPSIMNRPRGNLMARGLEGLDWQGSILDHGLHDTAGREREWKVSLIIQTLHVTVGNAASENQ
jgi:hypothetical protein